MRAQLSRDQSAKQFAEKLLELGEGNVVSDEKEYIKLNPICNLTDSIDDLVVFPNGYRMDIGTGYDGPQKWYSN